MDNVKLKKKEAKEIREHLATELVEKFVSSFKASDDDSDNGTFRVKMTDETVDRMGEVIEIKGWDFKNFLNNPVVLRGHSHFELPIGIVTNIETTPKGVFADGKFASAKANPVAQQVRKLFDMGIMKAVSVGFIEKEREGNIIKEAELIELSFVSVPANPNALATLSAEGMSINELAVKGLLDFDIKTTEPTKTKNKKKKVKNEKTKKTKKVSKKTTKKEKTIGDVFNLVKSMDDRLVALEGSTKSVEGSEGDSKGVKSKKIKKSNKKASKSETEKSLDEFSQKREILQVASTVLGEVLAESRQALKKKGELK